MSIASRDEVTSLCPCALDCETPFLLLELVRED